MSTLESVLKTLQVKGVSKKRRHLKIFNLVYKVTRSKKRHHWSIKSSVASLQSYEYVALT